MEVWKYTDSWTHTLIPGVDIDGSFKKSLNCNNVSTLSSIM